MKTNEILRVSSDNGKTWKKESTPFLTEIQPAHDPEQRLTRRVRSADRVRPLGAAMARVAVVCRQRVVDLLLGVASSGERAEVGERRSDRPTLMVGEAIAGRTVGGVAPRRPERTS